MCPEEFMGTVVSVTSRSSGYTGKAWIEFLLESTECHYLPGQGLAEGAALFIGCFD